MEILVTGTSGFVGGAIGRYLRSRGHRVIGLSRRPPRIGAADVAVTHDIRRPLPALPPFEAVVHAAALSAPWGRPRDFEAANVDGTRHVLDAAKRQDAFVLLVSSSSVLYAAGDQDALLELPAPDSPPVNDYARTKRAAEALVAAHPGRWAILRPRAVYGVGDTVLFPRIARAARLRLLPCFQRTTPAVGDIVSVDTLVRQVGRAVERRAKGIFHVIDPEPVVIETFVAKALESVGLPGPTWTVSPAVARKAATALEALSARSGWWEPPLTRFGVDVFATTKTFDDTRTRAHLGAPEIETDLAVARFAKWWKGGANLDDPVFGQVGAVP